LGGEVVGADIVAGRVCSWLGRGVVHMYLDLDLEWFYSCHWVICDSAVGWVVCQTQDGSAVVFARVLRALSSLDAQLYIEAEERRNIGA
jgi:hypothetical protein